MDNKSTYKCKYCGKYFPTNSNWNRHMKLHCEEKKKVGNNIDMLIRQQADFQEQINKLVCTTNKLTKNNRELMESNKELVKSNEEFKNRITYLETQLINKPTTINNISNTYNVVNNNTIIYSFGKEKLDFITDERWRAIFLKAGDCLDELVKTIYIENAQCRNIYISNMRSGYALVKIDAEWQIAQLAQIIDNIIDSKGAILNNKLTEFIKTRSSKSRSRTTCGFLMSVLYCNDFDIDKDLRRIVGNDIKMLLYNKRNIIKPSMEQDKNTNEN